ITPGTWHVLLGPYTVSPLGMNYEVDVTLRFGPAGQPFQLSPAPTSAPARRRGRDWYRGDGHLHTVHSDGKRTPAELVAAARAAGLDFIVSTEHNNPSASLQWGQHATDDLLILNGEEVTTRSGHWPAWNLPVGRWIDWRYRDCQPAEFRRFVDEVHSVGGLVVAAHPHSPCVGCSFGFRYDLVDAIEVWNGPWSLDDELSLATWDRLLRAGRWLPAVGNSDAHSEPQVVGLPHNVVYAQDLLGPFLFDGLKAGRNWIAESSGVRLSMAAYSVYADKQSAGIGERLPAQGPVEVVVEVGGAPGTTVRLVTPLGPAHLAEVPDSGAAVVRWTTSAVESAWVRAEVRRPVPTSTTLDTMVALTNPIFLTR
ncbi:MAG: PHP domain-containing protein, partial [Kutzneria sp.]|nr:PHP domain-containing protein [Kutzneria sp.]